MTGSRLLQPAGLLRFRIEPENHGSMLKIGKKKGSHIQYSMPLSACLLSAISLGPAH